MNCLGCKRFVDNRTISRLLYFILKGREIQEEFGQISSRQTQDITTVIEKTVKRSQIFNTDIIKLFLDKMNHRTVPKE